MEQCKSLNEYWWSWTLKLNIEKIKWTKVETKHHEEYEKQPLKTFTSTTKCGYVPNGRKRRSQDYRYRDVCSEWWGYSNRLQYYNIYGTMMKMYLKMLLSNLQQKQCTSIEDVHKEIH
jgi:hypothetical protein